MNDETRPRVSDDEVRALCEQMPAKRGETFHRVQEGYNDGRPRVVMIDDTEGEPMGIPVGPNAPPVLHLIGRLANDLRDARAELAAASGMRRDLTAAGAEVKATGSSALIAPDVRPGDVWRSVKGNRDVRVESVNIRTRNVCYRGKTGAVMDALAVNFVRGRVLVSRVGGAVTP